MTKKIFISSIEGKQLDSYVLHVDNMSRGRFVEETNFELYFAEGFWEGDVKLQGNKPLNEENRRKDLLETRKELTDFLKKEKGKEKLFLEARKRAEGVLKNIEREISTS